MKRLGLSRVELIVGLLVSAGSVALVSAAVELLRPYMPVLSLGVLYVFAVLAVAVFWGIVLAAVVSIASMLAFNWFFLPPTHTFQLRDGANWAVLAVYLVTAIVVSVLAARVRRRAEVAERREQEAAVLATMARDLLAGTELAEELERVGALTARVLGVPYARLEVGDTEAGEGEASYPIAVGRRHVATLLIPTPHALDREAADRFLPALASLLAVELDRAGLEAEALEAEALRRSDAIKTAVLHAVSHDLRSPLTAIIASAGALAKSDLSLDAADRESLVDAIREEATRLDRVVGNLLDLSRLQAGVTDTHPELWSVDELVAQAIEAVGRDGDRIVVELDPESPPVVVDAVQVERVLANLIENALKFSPPSSRVIVRTEHGATELRIHVVDYGPGIPAGNRDSIFQPFRRGDGSKARGAGLGLAIARGFAEANGGRLWAQDDGTGGHFVLALQVAAKPAVRT
jgi:two-component system, OmpR family, sensor histidine kinase KdpD